MELLDRLLGPWTIDDAAHFTNRLLAIAAALALLGFAVFLLRARGHMRRFGEHQARKAAEARTTAARLGLQASGGDPARIGPFPRLAGSPRTRILFEGDRSGFALTVLVQSFSQGDSPEIPDSITTMVCLASADLHLPAFSLTPALRLPAPGEAAIGLIAKVLRPLVRPGVPPEEEVDFNDPAFWPVYSVRAAVSSLAEGLATPDIRNVFTPAVRAFLVTRPGWSVEALNGRLLIYREDVEETPERMPAFLDEVLAIASVFRTPANP